MRREDAGRVAVVVVAGEVDLATADAVHFALREVAAGPLVLDLCETTFMDSSGLRVLLMVRERREDVLHVACAPDGPLARIFEVAGLEGQLSLHATRDAAVAAAAGS